MRGSMHLYLTDLRLGLICTNAFILIVFALAFVVQMLIFSKLSSIYPEYLPSIQDGLTLLTAGSVSDQQSVSKSGAMPWGWIMFYLLMLFILLLYPCTAQGGLGSKPLIAFGSKLTWWFTKLIWIACCTLALYAALLLSSFLAIWVHQGTSDGGISPILLEFLGFDLANLASESPTIWGAFGLSCFVLFLLGTMQFAIAVLLNPLVAYIVSSAVVLLSPFCQHPLLLGNWLMAMRSNTLCVNGLNILHGFALAVILFCITASFGYRQFRNKDIL